jgi:transcriptional regulator with XRE-family HTH domain
MAKLLGIHQQAYWRYEKIRTPRVLTLIDIAARCNVTIDWLTGRCDFKQCLFARRDGETCPCDGKLGREYDPGIIAVDAVDAPKMATIVTGEPLSDFPIPSHNQINPLSQILGKIERDLGRIFSILSVQEGK